MSHHLRPLSKKMIDVKIDGQDKSYEMASEEELMESVRRKIVNIPRGSNVKSL